MKKILLWLLASGALLAIAVVAFGSTPRDYHVLDQDVQDAFDLLNNSLVNPRHTYFDFLGAGHPFGSGTFTGEITATPSMGVHNGINYARLDRDDAVVFELEVTTGGLYELALAYRIPADTLRNLTITVLVNGELQFDEAATIDVPLRWQDISKDFTVDRWGDESLPLQTRIDEWGILELYNNTYYTVDPLLFNLQPGRNVITMTNMTSEVLLLGELIATQPRTHLTYQEYLASFPVEQNVPSTLIYVNATSYIEKNSSFVRLTSINNPVLEPFDPVFRRLNVLDGNAWEQPGQSVTFEFTVPQTGWYEIGFHYMNEENDFDVFRSIAINGQIPFAELRNYAFAPTNIGRWEHEILGNDDGNFRFYLEAGVHTLTLRAEYENLSPHIRNLQLVGDHINQLALDIMRITGNDVDQNRTWNLTRLLPATPDYLAAYRTILQHTANELAAYAPNSINSSMLSFLNRAIIQLEEMSQRPDELPLHLDRLSQGSGSVAQMIGDTIANLTAQPLFISGFYVFYDHALPAPNASAFSRLSNQIQSFGSTFTSDRFSIVEDPDALNVWVSRPITHIHTMQRLVDAYFTPETGVRVNILAMPDANRLILANAANISPDIALGLASHMSFDLAIRGAIYDLTQFPDFWEVADRFAPGAFVPLIFDDGIYALPETLEFQALVYRRDIMESLGLAVPDTWDDVTDILPTLQRYGMNFFHPMAGGGSLKWFFQTAPFIYQHGGTLYAADGSGVAINSPEAVQGIHQLNNLFRTYALPAQVASFYNSFREGTLPIGIVMFSEFLQIQNAAPELVGKWDLALFPGTVQADGELSRWFIANGVTGVIFEDTNNLDASWEFMKWWTSETVQTMYSLDLQSTFGPEFMWLSANLAAASNSTLDHNHLDVMLESATWLRDVPRIPGHYMLERGLSNIWNQAVFGGVSTRVAIDREIIGVDRELRRKMTEFGFLDEHGNVIRPYHVREIDWVIEQINYHLDGGQRNGGVEAHD